MPTQTSLLGRILGWIFRNRPMAPRPPIRPRPEEPTTPERIYPGLPPVSPEKKTTPRAD